MTIDFCGNPRPAERCVESGHFGMYSLLEENVAKIYKIHPAIGVARLGNDPNAFYIGPEMAGSPGMEIDAAGSESPVTSYKDNGRVKRQAARFRVFEYDQELDGTLRLVGEVDAETQVAWTVDLVNRKGALARTVGPAEPRNTGVTDRQRLVIRNPHPVTITGPTQSAQVLRGQFLGKDVYLGEARTDSQGRLIVLGGRGGSGSVPPGALLRNFANNDRWHDDVSDGPVSATVTVPGQAPVVVHEGGWVVVAPPDFAPAVRAVVSLYDIAYQCGIDKGALQPATVPSFTQHIKPMIERTADLRWVDSWTEWNDLQPLDWDALADPSPASQAARQNMADEIRTPGLALFGLPDFMRTYLTKWEAGNFVNDLANADPPAPLPEQLDRAALDGCSGNNFFPGIEAGQNLKDKNIYARPFRLDLTNTAKVYPGCLTEIMAVPWQADFLACDGGVWWPTQRPDMVMADPNSIPGSTREWEEPITSFAEMVQHVLRLGFIVPQQVDGQTVLVEVDRDPQFPRHSV